MRGERRRGEKASEREQGGGQGLVEVQGGGSRKWRKRDLSQVRRDWASGEREARERETPCPRKRKIIMTLQSAKTVLQEDAEEKAWKYDAGGITGTKEKHRFYGVLWNSGQCAVEGSERQHDSAVGKTCEDPMRGMRGSSASVQRSQSGR